VLILSKTGILATSKAAEVAPLNIFSKNDSEPTHLSRIRPLSETHLNCNRNLTKQTKITAFFDYASGSGGYKTLTTAPLLLYCGAEVSVVSH
jgi:hypothetical protein